jgi:hypothetical protein
MSIEREVIKMKGYVFTYGVDGFGADIAPAHEFGVYLDFKKAFAKLMELNHKQLKKRDFYEDGYGEDYYPEDDVELAKAEETDNWDLYDRLMRKHIITNEEEINKEFINTEPCLGMYALDEIEIIE